MTKPGDNADSATQHAHAASARAAAQADAVEVVRRISTDPAWRRTLALLAFRLLWDRHEAEDAVQEALLAAHRKAGTLREAASVRSWLCSIVVRQCRLRQRQRRQRNRLATALAERVQRDEPASTEADESAAVEPAMMSATMRRLRQALRRLPDRQREVVVLRHLQQMSYDEVAAVLEMAPSTARVHAKAGREALRDMLPDLHHPA